MIKLAAQMKVFLRVLRWIRRQKRRVLGRETPHWAQDAYKAIKPLNIFELIPTLVAIFFAPTHFFGRVELYVRKRSSGTTALHRAPLGFAFRIATLLIGLSAVIPSVPSSQSLKWSVAVSLLISMPLALPLLSALLLIIAAPAYILPNVLPLSLNNKRDRENKRRLVMWLIVPLCPGTYRHLSWSSVLWSSLYFYGYMIAIPAVVVSFAAMNVDVLLRPAIAKEWRDMTILMGLTSLAIGRIALYPYTAMLIACTRHPTRVMRRIQTDGLRIAMERVFRSACTYTGLKEQLACDQIGSVEEETFRKDVIALEAEFATWQHAWTRECIHRRLEVDTKNRKTVAVETLPWYLLALAIEASQSSQPVADLCGRIHAVLAAGHPPLVEPAKDKT